MVLGFRVQGLRVKDVLGFRGLYDLRLKGFGAKGLGVGVLGLGLRGSIRGVCQHFAITKTPVFWRSKKDTCL